MIVEGRGAVAPPKVRIPLEQRILDRLRRVAEDRERKRGYAKSRIVWRSGFVSNPTLTGLAGEYAFSVWASDVLGFHVPLDLEDRPQGDGGRDFTLFRRRIQVKCRERDYGCALVRRETGQGRIVPIEWDYLVLATLVKEESEGSLLFEDDGEGGRRVVALDGWATRGEILSSRFTFARRGDHHNLETSDRHLEPMCDLARLLKMWQQGEGNDDVSSLPRE